MLSKIEHFLKNGYNCSQIMVLLALEEMDMNDDLTVKAAAGLGRGIGNCGKTCGILTGAALAVGMLSNGGNEPTDEITTEIVGELVEWFSEEYGATDCRALLERSVKPCARLIAETAEKTFELLKSYGFARA